MSLQQYVREVDNAERAVAVVLQGLPIGVIAPIVHGLLCRNAKLRALVADLQGFCEENGTVGQHRISEIL